MTASSRNLENLASTRSSTTQLSIPEENTGRRSEDEQNEDVVVCVESSMELEGMSEERLAENYASLSKGAIMKLRRVLARSSAHSQEIQRCRKAMDKIHSRAKQQDERAVFASEHTELLSSTMDMLTKEPCSLCRYVFLKKNLTTRVSYKSICDLRASWRSKTHVGKHDASETGPETSPSHGNNSHWNDWDDPQSDHMQDLDPINQVLDVSQISHLYDEVPVCVFCAQLLLDYPSYRPSSAQQRQQKEAKHLAALERRKLRDEQRERDKQRCDPLDFDPSALNSDEDNSDTDEFLVYKPDGRVDVVRHRRHRSTIRVPAQLGFVSKRLHYDHLRTQSIRVLNRKEWDLIVRSHSTKQV
ncbi:hypothetical protein Poli38472_003735 [Pythium oligandrum]|uniref:Uncharacterized protein n=1 Tax=Pythium oligandrum TaxID=41045 RepID=A0A8K1FJE0_PYTOL|nr:hypothetical protein Poli38472_003735 [Pythium oligandrum]|eukprot:TMW65970.1 hypothetical protein Poli38472_003735 [Pythium oligandrum]